jgi:hypothetical protein
MSKLAEAFKANRKVVVLSFEIFWILFFILETLGNRSGAGIPQFIYVNF